MSDADREDSSRASSARSTPWYLVRARMRPRPAKLVRPSKVEMVDDVSPYGRGFVCWLSTAESSFNACWQAVRSTLALFSV